MKTYIALLRGINVSGQKIIRMADLRITMEKLGLQHVSTYIQSGNICFQSENTGRKELETKIWDGIYSDFGFEVPTLVLDGEDITSILKSNPFKDETNEKGLYFVLLKEAPSKVLVSEFGKLEFENEDFHVISNCVYLNCKTGLGKAKLNTNLIEKKLGVQATARNLRTMNKLLEMIQDAKG